MNVRTAKMVPISSAVLCLHFLLLIAPGHGISRRSLEDPIISTDKGHVRGVRNVLSHPVRKYVDAFLGIPFAKPPVGNLRFRHPQPIDRWDGVYNATRLPNSCYQSRDRFFGNFSGSAMWNPNTAMSEDCLYLNVWVPRVRPRTSNIAVMVWIYGGGFYSGSTTLDIYDGKILAAVNDVIVVSIAYRVGALGFLGLNTPDIPGNAGLFDQLMGLEWVKQNIRNFGGDPENVNIFGESAGGVSVSLHLLSPLSKPNFQRAIMQSGSANMEWATVTPYEGKRRSLELAHDYLQCPHNDDMEEVVDCLREVEPDDIIIQQSAMTVLFLPVIDGVFLTEPPDVTLKRGSFKRCPVLMGSNLNEGSYFLLYELPDLLTLDSVSMDREQFVSSVNRLVLTYSYQTANNAVMDAILFQYTNWSNPNDTLSNIASLDAAYGDFHFTCSVNEFARAYADAGEGVYMYYLTHRYSSNPWPEWTGVMHADDLIFLFGLPLQEQADYTAEEQQLAYQIMRYWTNFAKTGDPNQIPGGPTGHSWPPYTADGQEYLELNAKFLTDQSMAIGRGPRMKECVFWNEYLPELQHQTACIGSGAKSSWSNNQTFTLLVIGIMMFSCWIPTK